MAEQKCHVRQPMNNPNARMSDTPGLRAELILLKQKIDPIGTGGRSDA